MKGPFLNGYVNALSSLRGWTDGDEFYVNYIGHPMQGAVTGFIWVHNDRDYRTAEFGDGRVYWKSRVRAAAYAWAYSTQFEIGPISEASLGKIQAYHPQQGFVDHVVTPVIGTAWMAGEDAIDRYVIRWIEGKVRNPYVLLLARGGLNPTRSFANAMRFKVPWARDTRPGVFTRQLHGFLDAQRAGLIEKPHPVAPEREGPFGIALFEVSMTYRPVFYRYNGTAATCLGGAGEGAFRLSPNWQLALDVSGCDLRKLPDGWTGDTLTYVVGPRWTPRAGDRWSPYVQAMIGGMQVTKERERVGTHINSTVTQLQRNSLAMTFGGGLDLRMNPAVALRVGRLEYKHVWSPADGMLAYGNGMSFSMGLVLRAGTW